MGFKNFSRIFKLFFFSFQKLLYDDLKKPPEFFLLFKKIWEKNRLFDDENSCILKKQTWLYTQYYKERWVFILCLKEWD